jgi:lipoate-protein ligase A
MPRQARLIIDPPAPGSWNMAVDEALLQTAGGGEPPTLRLYRWSEPTLSLGYFQRAADRRLHPASAGCEMVRRSSGGGAILHDRELTYSFVTPQTGRGSPQAETLYGVFHESLIEALGRLGVTARLVAAPDGRSPAEQPFLCFQRRSRGDVVADQAKVVGSAQRRRSHGMLQHGSILLGRSDFAPELPGMTDLTGRPFPADRLLDEWLPRLSERLAIRFEQGGIRDAERAVAQTLVVDRFGHDSWTLRR